MNQNQEENVGVIPENKEITLESLSKIKPEDAQNFIRPDLLEKLNQGEMPTEIQDLLNAFFQEHAKQNNPETLSLQAKDMLEEKYGKEFEVVRFKPRNITDNYFSVDAYDKEKPYNIFNARVNVEKNSISDSYMIRVCCDKIKDKVMDVLDLYAGDTDVFVESWIQYSNIEEREADYLTLSRCLPDNYYSIEIFFTLPEEGEMPEIKKENIIKIAEELESYRGNIKCYVLPEEKRREAFEYIESHSRLYSDFKDKFDDFLAAEFEFESKNVNIDDESFVNLQKRIAKN